VSPAAGVGVESVSPTKCDAVCLPHRIELGEGGSDVRFVDHSAIQGEHLLLYVRRPLLATSDAFLQIGQSLPGRRLPVAGFNLREQLANFGVPMGHVAPHAA
jgi:hypothetical protein